MLLLVRENLLDEIAAGGIVSGCRCLRRRVQHGTRIALQRHVVVEYLSHCGANGWRVDSERRCTVEIAEAIKKGIDRDRLIGSPHSHLTGKTFETPCFDESDMGLMLRVSAPRRTQQAIQDCRHWVDGLAHTRGDLYSITCFRNDRHRILPAYMGARVVPPTRGGGLAVYGSVFVGIGGGHGLGLVDGRECVDHPRCDARRMKPAGTTRDSDGS